MLNVDTVMNAAVNCAKSQAGEDRITEVQFYTGYAEPGYDGDKIAVGNWNSITVWDSEGQKSNVVDDTPERLANLLEKMGYELEWSDEWDTCGDCGKLIRTQANGYDWTPSYVVLSDFVACAECIKENHIVEYLEEISGNDIMAHTLDFPLEDYGYKRVEQSFENGFYGGQTDHPKHIANALMVLGVRHFIFNLDAVGQFDTNFSVYVHKDEFRLLPETIEAHKGKDPADVLRENLQSAEMKTIIPQEFVEGTWKD